MQLTKHSTRLEKTLTPHIVYTLHGYAEDRTCTQLKRYYARYGYYMTTKTVECGIRVYTQATVQWNYIPDDVDRMTMLLLLVFAPKWVNVNSRYRVAWDCTFDRKLLRFIFSWLTPKIQYKDRNED